MMDGRVRTSQSYLSLIYTPLMGVTYVSNIHQSLGQYVCYDGRVCLSTITKLEMKIERSL